MIPFISSLNTCFLTTEASRDIALYSHLIPVFFALALSILVFFKAKSNILSRVFLSFSFVFSLWLIGDVITWTSNNYFLVYTTWSFLAYIEIIFFILGLYFTRVFVRKSDISIIEKIILFFVTLLPLFITITQKSVTGFGLPFCEASNNTLLDTYKLYVEILILAIIFIHLLMPFFKKVVGYTKKTSLILLGSMFLFLSVFGISEYFAASTGNYELNLYALFVIPVFLIAITYSIFSLDIFNLKIVSTYFLVFGLLLLIASQLLFVSNSANRLLTILTLVLSISLAFLLFKNLKRESEQRIYIEKLNVDLRNVIQQRESLVHLITHKVKGSFTRTKYIFAEMLNNSFGPLTPEMKNMAEHGLESDAAGIRTIDLVLNASNLQNGSVKYDMKIFDLKDLVSKGIDESKVSVENKKLELITDIKDDTYNILGDAFWMKEVVHNLIENSIKYTLKGSITVGLVKKDKKIIFSVKDTGVGITDEDKKNLFTEGGRGKESVKVNVDSTGYGLYSVKLIVDTHGGRVWAESEGPGKGSTFFAEFDAI